MRWASPIPPSAAPGSTCWRPSVESAVLSELALNWGDVGTVTLPPLPPPLPNQWPLPMKPYQASSNMSTMTTMAKTATTLADEPFPACPWRLLPDKLFTSFVFTIGREAQLELVPEFRNGGASCAGGSAEVGRLLGLRGPAGAGRGGEMPGRVPGDPVEGVGQVDAVGGARLQRRIGEKGEGIFRLGARLQGDARQVLARRIAEVEACDRDPGIAVKGGGYGVADRIAGVRRRVGDFVAVEGDRDVHLVGGRIEDHAPAGLLAIRHIHHLDGHRPHVGVTVAQLDEIGPQ